MSIGLAPAATFAEPSLTIDWARTVAVVVPSPATSLVLVAASLRSCAPMFSKGSSSSMSLATVTPSWVTVGAPHFLSRATLRPFGPRVVLTASARPSTPLLSDRRASRRRSAAWPVVVPPEVGRSVGARPSARSSAAAAPEALLSPDDRENVLLADDEQLLVVELDLGAGVLRVEDLVARLRRPSASRLPSSASGPGRRRRPCPPGASPWLCPGSTMPLLVISSRAVGLTTTRSPSGRTSSRSRWQSPRCDPSCDGRLRPTTWT